MDLCLFSKYRIVTMNTYLYEYIMCMPNHHIALLCNKAGRQINALSRLSNGLNVDTKMLILQSFILSHFMYCCIIWHFCSISDTKKIEKMQLKALRHIYI